jgi:hypothetical protein
MATKQGQRAEINTFVQGIITEASPLNFPPNASREEENFVLKRDGSRRRRLGMDYEEFATLRTAGTAADFLTKGYTSFNWLSVSGDNTQEFVVIQVGKFLHFYDVADMEAGDGYIDDIELTGFAADTVYSMAGIEGKLVVVGGAEDIAIITHTAGVFTVEYEVLKVRDFWGVEVTDTPYEDDPFYRTAVPYTTDILNLHRYNLQNQSWALPRKDKNGLLSDPIALYSTEYPNKYPSNSEVVWTGLQFQPVVDGDDPYERIFPSLYQEVANTSPTAAKGFYKIDLINRGASRIAEFENNYSNSGSVLLVPTFTTVDDISDGGASIVTEYAGRVWFTGFSGGVTDGDARSPNLSNYIAFSQLVKNSRDIVKCYQEGDPTSRDSSDVVDSDGGFLKIAGAKRILAIRSIRTHLIVFADNGVWAISGNTDMGFTATGYGVSKITESGCISAESVVVEGENVLYWSDEGIYTISRDKFAQLAPSNITQTTIQTLYDDIPLEVKRKCRGVYDKLSKRVVWLYKTGTVFTSDSVTQEITLDTSLSSFSQNRVMNLDDFSHEVVEPFYNRGLKYVFAKKAGTACTFSTCAYNNTSFLDWESVDDEGVDAFAYLLTGSQIAGDSSIPKQITYLFLHFEKTESATDAFGVPLNQSGCLFRTQWDWAGGSQSNKFGSLAQGYRYRRAYFAALPDTAYDNGFEVVTSKNKVRGRGKAFALYLETEPLKDCIILGWNLTINGNGNP